MDFRQIHRGCVDKRRYYTKRFAREAAKRAGLNFYHCPFCSFWHLTSRGTPEKVGEEDHNRPWQPKGK